MKHVARNAETASYPNAMSAFRRSAAVKVAAATAVTASLVSGCGQPEGSNIVSVRYDIGDTDVSVREPIDRVTADRLEIKGTVYGLLEDELLDITDRFIEYQADVAAPIDVALLACESDKEAVSLVRGNNEVAVVIRNPVASESIPADLTYIAEDGRVYECEGAEIMQEPSEALPKTAVARTIDLPFGEIRLPETPLLYEDTLVSLPDMYAG